MYITHEIPVGVTVQETGFDQVNKTDQHVFSASCKGKKDQSLRRCGDFTGVNDNC